MAIKIHIDGLADLQKSINKLEAKLQKRVYREATKAAGDIIVRAAKSSAPKSSGALASALVHRVSSKPSKGFFGIKVSVKGGKFRSQRTALRRKGRQQYKPDAVDRYYRFVERKTKHNRAQPFLLPSLEGQKSEIIREIKSALAAAIEKHRP